ncbi:MAG: PilC/PilY family type IV pilus protein [Gammaproteobacteria bacterium]|nr:PilC/PilY family type IV pilus protein [Gammaproteobacteria bacterium]
MKRLGLSRFLLKSAAGLILGFAGLAGADPDEAWLSRAPLPASIRPLLVIAVDTSASMGEPIRLAVPYDPSTDYAAGATRQCDSRRVYWRRGPGPAPDCLAMAGLALSATPGEIGLQCDAARAALARYGYFVSSRAAQWNPSGSHWGALSVESSDPVECRSDRAHHGREAGPWFATDGPTGPWSQSPESEIDWDAAPLGDPYIFYAGNFLNYLAAAGPTTQTTRMAAVTAEIVAAVSATDGLDVALVRYSDRVPDAEGGFVLLAPVSAAVAALQLPALLNDISPSGGAPIAETMAEIVLWLSGGPVLYGDDARADIAARDRQDPAHYLSPFLCPCRPVTIALVTGGTSSQDAGAGPIARSQPGFTELTGDCDASCLPAIGQWLTQSDLREDLPGRQFAQLTWVAPSPLPSLVAESLDRAGGTAEILGGPLGFANVVARSLQHDAAVAAGAQLSSAGLLLTPDSTHEPAVIYGMSAPRARQRWLGNLLRYRLQAPATPLSAPVAIGRDGEPALDPVSGLPRDGSISAWSSQPDGDAPLLGGAAGRLPAAQSRRLYSDVTTDALTSARNRLASDNALLSAALFGLASHDRETQVEVVSWLLNQRQLGDPGLRAPISVNYGMDGGRTTFVATHDGLLHAFDTDTGVERWAFIPRPLLARLPELMRDESTTARSHGIDGPLVLHRHDSDGDGRIDASAGEHLWLIFGFGRGGSGYYALDVGSPDEPRLMWSLAPGDLDDGAESWPEPVITQLSVASSGQNPGSWVVVLAGGYDRAYDSRVSPVRTSGASLSIFDAATGRRLWRAAGSAALSPDLHLPEMTVSLPSAPRVLDMDGDGFADRMYVIDVEGGLWRMDLQHGASPASLARAHLVARLGGPGQRFDPSPDV